jgi:large subunit ribosomal protein L2
VKRHIRVIDWKQDKFEIPGKIATIEYDPNRGARIALVTYRDGEKRYILAPQGLSVGMGVISSKQKGDPIPGSRFPLAFIPEGATIYNIELQPGKGGPIVRGAGTSAMLLAIEGEYATVRLPSGEMRMVLASCMATIGSVSNPDWRLIRWGKAGRTRMRSIRPTVRGKVMNPCDHPHGGGEGKNSIGLKYPKTAQGKHALGVRTRKAGPTDLLIIRRRYQK